MKNTQQIVKSAVLVGSLAPFVLLALRALRGSLGANPIAELLNQLGLLTLVFLLASLACSPLKILFGWKWPIAVRRTIGLFAFFSALAHFLVYLVLDQNMALGAVFADVVERPFIAVGFAAFLILLPLAVTSTKRALQKLGPKRWKLLHRLAYVAGILGVLHYFLRVKRDITDPLVYAAALGLLLAIRLGELIAERLAKSRKRALRQS